ncbi:hypothetical protein ACWEQL_35020 [Kitasatospora sp. NPDC004240]
MIRKLAVAAAVGGLLLSGAGWASADSGHRAGDILGTGFICGTGDASAAQNNCGNTNTFDSDILGSVGVDLLGGVLNLLPLGG